MYSIDIKKIVVEGYLVHKDLILDDDDNKDKKNAIHGLWVVIIVKIKKLKKINHFLVIGEEIILATMKMINNYF